jgi:ketosteroid isomerase-like protein
MNKNQIRQEIIEDFINAYNTFDINGMLKDLHEDIKFENISDGRVNLKTDGIEKFKKQAENTREYFKEREQKIIDLKFKEEIIEVKIKYLGILAKDLPNGLKSGDTLRIEGKSIFRFRDDKIISIQDIS